MQKKSQDSWLKKIKMVAFDLDATLYPPSPALSERIQSELYQAIAVHLDCSEAQAREELSNRKKRLHSTTRSLFELGIDGESFFTELWEKLDLEQFIPDDPALFRAVAATPIKLAIVTNSNSQKIIRQKLQLIGLDPNLFHPIISSVDLGTPKPSPEPFKALLDQSKLHPDQILLAGDREETDIIPAQKMGMYTCLIHWGNYAQTTADLSYRSPTELLELIRLSRQNSHD